MFHGLVRPAGVMALQRRDDSGRGRTAPVAARRRSGRRAGRRRPRRAPTKAELRRAFATSLDSAVRAIRIANRPMAVAEKLRHLDQARDALEACLAIRAGNHYLRNQLRACEEIRGMLAGGAGARSDSTVEVILDPRFRFWGLQRS
jgi:hypothetical protein